MKRFKEISIIGGIVFCLFVFIEVFLFLNTVPSDQKNEIIFSQAYNLSLNLRNSHPEKYIKHIWEDQI